LTDFSSVQYTCACPTHHTLGGDEMSCVPPRSYLIYSMKNSFGRLLPNSSDSPDAPLTVSTKYIKAVEYDPIQHHVYWVRMI
jgi:low density lipoprotein receptor-related protein 5/6